MLCAAANFSGRFIRKIKILAIIFSSLMVFVISLLDERMIVHSRYTSPIFNLQESGYPPSCGRGELMSEARILQYFLIYHRNP